MIARVFLKSQGSRPKKLSSWGTIFNSSSYGTYMLSAARIQVSTSEGLEVVLCASALYASGFVACMTRYRARSAGFRPSSWVYCVVFTTALYSSGPVTS